MVSATRLLLNSAAGDSLSLDLSSTSSLGIHTHHAGPALTDASTVTIGGASSVGAVVGSALSATTGETMNITAQWVPGGNSVVMRASPTAGQASIRRIGTGTIGAVSLELAEQGIFSYVRATNLADWLNVSTIDDCSLPTADRRVVDAKLSQASGVVGSFDWVYGRLPPTRAGDSTYAAITCEDGLNANVSLTNFNQMVLDLLPCGFRFALPGSNVAGVPFYFATTSGLIEGQFHAQDTAAIITTTISCESSGGMDRTHFDYDIQNPLGPVSLGAAKLLVRYTDLGILDCMKLFDACVKLLSVNATNVGPNAGLDSNSSASIVETSLRGSGGDDLEVYIYSDTNTGGSTGGGGAGTATEAATTPDLVDISIDIPLEHVGIVFTNVSQPMGGTSGQNVVDLVAVSDEKTLVVNLANFQDAAYYHKSIKKTGPGNDDVDLRFNYNGTSDAPLDVYVRSGTGNANSHNDCDINRFTIGTLPNSIMFTYTRKDWVTNSATLSSSGGIDFVEWSNRLGSGCAGGANYGEVFASIKDIPSSYTVGYHLQPQGYVQAGNANGDVISYIQLGYRSSENPDHYIDIATKDLGVGFHWNLVPGGGDPMYAYCTGTIGANIGVQLRWGAFGVGAFYKVDSPLQCPEFMTKADLTWGSIIQTFIDNEAIIQRFGCLQPPAGQKFLESIAPWELEVVIGSRVYPIDFDWAGSFSKGDCPV